MKFIYLYDRVGNKIRESIKNNTDSCRITNYEYDYKNRLSQVYNSAEKTRYTYDKADNILSVTRGLGNNTQVTSYEYDNRNQLIKYTDAMGQPETYVYDNYGNMVSKTDRNGDIMKYTYDALGNCLSEEGKDVNNTFTYNLLGNVKTASNGNVQQSFTYNDMGLLKKENTVINGTTFLAENFYKEFGVLSAETYEKNNKRYSAVEYTTDIYGRQTSAEFTEGINVVLNAEYTYDKNSNITEIKDNNMTRKYEYNKANLITGVTNTNNKNVKTSYRYSYYPDGNIAHYVNHYNATMDYTYDSANRVVKEVYGEDANMPFTIGYTYDEFGNLSKKDYRDDDNPAYVTTYSYDKNNRLTKESQIVSNGSTKWQNITTYGYDKNGNRLNRIKYKQNVDNTKFKLNLTDSAYKYYDYGKEVYTYDGLNELKTYRGKKEESATYEYMANHYRISKTVDGTKTYQLWDNDRVVSELDSELNLKINYRIGVNGQILSDSNETSYSYDGHGNLINENGNYSTNVYDAYGNKTEDFGTGDAPFGYCGEYTDKESGLVYLRNRYYDPSTGSFITEDKHWNTYNMIYGDKEYKKDEIKYPDYLSIMQSGNLYGYCIGNPINYSDAQGSNINDVVLASEREVWKKAAQGFKLFGYELTGRLLELSASGQANPEFYASDGTYAANLLRGNKELRSEINNRIYNEATKIGASTVYFNGKYTFTTGDGDVGAALHEIRYTVNGRMINGKWKVSINLSDTFDFTEFVNPITKAEKENGIGKYLKGIILWSGNDVAYLEQKLDVLRPVSVHIQYTDTFG